MPALPRSRRHRRRHKHRLQSRQQGLGETRTPDLDRFQAEVQLRSSNHDATRGGGHDDTLHLGVEFDSPRQGFPATEIEKASDALSHGAFSARSVSEQVIDDRVIDDAPGFFEAQSAISSEGEGPHMVESAGASVHGSDRESRVSVSSHASSHQSTHKSSGESSCSSSRVSSHASSDEFSRRSSRFLKSSLAEETPPRPPDVSAHTKSPSLPAKESRHATSFFDFAARDANKDDAGSTSGCSEISEVSTATTALSRKVHRQSLSQVSLEKRGAMWKKHLEERAELSRRKQRKQEKQLERLCTFQPNLPSREKTRQRQSTFKGRKSKVLKGELQQHVRRSSSEETASRLYAARFAKMKRLQELREEQRKTETMTASFRPKICEASRRRAEKSGYVPVHERAAEIQRQRKAYLDARRQQIQEARDQRFRPRLSSLSKKIAEKARKRRENAAKQQLQHVVSHRRQSRDKRTDDRDDSSSCTGTEVHRLLHGLPQAPGEEEANAGERLLREHQQRQLAKTLDRSRKLFLESTERELKFEPKVNERSNEICMRARVCGKQVPDFLMRQEQQAEEAERKKAEKRIAAQRQWDQQHRRRSKTRTKHAPKPACTVDVMYETPEERDTRLSFGDWLQRERRRIHRSQQVIQEAGCTFRPAINKRSQEIVAKRKSEAKLERGGDRWAALARVGAKKQLARVYGRIDEARDSSDQVPSRKKRKTPLPSFVDARRVAERSYCFDRLTPVSIIERIEDKRDTQRRQVSQIKARRERIESQECTFQPRSFARVKQPTQPVIVRGLDRFMDFRKKARHLAEEKRKAQEADRRVNYQPDGVTKPEPFDLSAYHASELREAAHCILEDLPHNPSKGDVELAVQRHLESERPLYALGSVGKATRAKLRRHVMRLLREQRQRFSSSNSYRKRPLAKMQFLDETIAGDDFASLCLESDEIGIPVQTSEDAADTALVTAEPNTRAGVSPAQRPHKQSLLQRVNTKRRKELACS